jgi:hypothetical protein
MRARLSLALALILAVAASATLQAQIPIEIEVRLRAKWPMEASLDQPFGRYSVTCPLPPGPAPVTISDLLGSDVRALKVGAFNESRFKTEAQLRDYIRAMLVARPESGGFRPLAAWSEFTYLEVSMVIEWMDGRFGRFDLGSMGSAGRNQYAHLEDRRGCERWARFRPR